MFEKKQTAKDIREARKRRRMAWLQFLVLFILILAALFVVVSRRYELRINRVVVLGAETVFPLEVEEFIIERISGETFFVPHNNFLLVQKKIIRDEVLAKFSRIDDIKFNIKNFQRLEVIVKEHDPRYVWCSTPLVLEDRACWFLDDAGSIVTEAPLFSRGVFFTLYGRDDSVGIAPLEQSLLEQVAFEKITALKELLVVQGFEVASVHLGDNEDTLRFTIERLRGKYTTGELLVDSNASNETVITNLKRALATEPLATNLITRVCDLEYIDVRFENKVYYKFK